LKPPLKIAIAGLGTVGAGVLRLIAKNGALLAARSGRPIVVTAISARTRGRDRGVDLAPFRWFDDPVAMAAEAEAEIVVELIGGAEGPAKAVVETAIARRRHVVTANKALLAKHGTAIGRAAEAAGIALHYEAAVAGGIPIIKAMREGLAGNRIERLYGILNGTCNYILTTMRETGRSFDAVLADAQALGYAEADPSFDIDGIDTAHKLAILASVAFGGEIDFDGVYIEGIRHVTAEDIQFAAELGYRIKLLGSARLTDHGIEQRVHPCMVKLSSPIASVEGVYNAVFAEGDFVGTALFEGRGAGAGPTASAVVADIVDIARENRLPVFGLPAAALARRPRAPIERHRGAYYLRLMVKDEPGVFADIAAIFRDERVSMEAILQRQRDANEPVPVVITTHETEEAAMRRALSRIAALATIAEPPRMIRIEPLER